jgi:hypothetical protein
MKSACTTKKKRQLMQVEWKWCSKFSKDNLKHKFYIAHNLWEEAPLPSITTTSKCHFSPRLPSGSPKIGTLIIPKLWMFIYISNQVCFGNARAISYIPQKDLFTGV